MLVIVSVEPGKVRKYAHVEMINSQVMNNGQTILKLIKKNTVYDINPNRIVKIIKD